MKINGWRFVCERPLFVYFKKHYCPFCGNKLMRTKVSRMVNSDSEEAENYDFVIADVIVKGYVKFTHVEFFCFLCQRNFTVKEIKARKKD